MNNRDFDEVFEGDFKRRTRHPRDATRVRQSYNEEILAPTFGDEGDAGVPHAHLTLVFFETFLLQGKPPHPTLLHFIEE